VPEKVPCAQCGKPVSADQAAKRGGLCILCSIKREEKIPCLECGAPVSASGAAKRNGLCLRCSAKRNPFFVLYSSLIDRVCNSPAGFDALSDGEKLYYALTLFENEVNNGGFHQFFFNSSGSYYGLIETALVTFDEPNTLELLHQAKQIVFPDVDVPADLGIRRNLLPAPTPDLMNKLDELDQRFYRTPSDLGAKLQSFAREKGLVLPETDDK
jgi:Domain of unknown function (DUF4375)